MLITIGLYADDINIINTCNGIEVRDIKTKPYTARNGEKQYLIQYVVKNTTNKNFELVTLAIFLKDDNGNRISEALLRSDKLKAHYEEPIEKGTYNVISPLPSDFNGKADLEVKCNEPSGVSGSIHITNFS